MNPFLTTRYLRIALALLLVLPCTGCFLFNGEGDTETAWKALQARDPNQAIRYSSRAIAFGKLSGEKLGSAYECRATANLRKRQPRRALEDMNVLVQLRPDYAGGYFIRAEAGMALKQTDQALEDLNQGLKIADPQGTEKSVFLSRRYGQRGLIWLVKKEFSKAGEDFTRTLENDPANPEGYYGRSFVYQHENKLPQALQDMETAFKLGTKNHDSAGFKAIDRYFPRLYKLRRANGLDGGQPTESVAEAGAPTPPPPPESSGEPWESKPLIGGD